MVSCTTPTPETPPPTASAPKASVVVDRRLVEVHLTPADVWTGVHQRDELAGLVTALVESGLSDLVDTAGIVDGVPVTPGLEGRLTDGAEVWTGRIGVVPSGDALRYGLLLCDPEGLCEDEEAVGTREAPEAAVAQLLDQSAKTLGAKPIEDARAHWAVPQSKDDYAELICGRSAAVFYGLRPATPDAYRGDQRKDPIQRAVYIDPGMSVGWWISGRSWVPWDVGRARESFTRAAIAFPGSVLFQADEAATLAANGKWEAAWLAWQDVDQRSPGDLRFAVPRARAALSSDHVKEALAILDGLPPRYQDERSVAEMRVAIAEKTGQSSNYDDLLANWQKAAPADPEPVRRRIALRVEDHRWDEALTLTDELEVRGEQEEAARLAMALGVGLGRLDDAAQRADALGEPALAERIRTRAAVEADPSALPPSLAAASDPMGRLAAGEAYLRRQQPDAALAEAQAVLAVEPWMPEALDLAARADDALGKAEDAKKARARRDLADPAWRD